MSFNINTANHNRTDNLSADILQRMEQVVSTGGFVENWPARLLDGTNRSHPGALSIQHPTKDSFKVRFINSDTWVLVEKDPLDGTGKIVPNGSWFQDDPQHGHQPSVLEAKTAILNALYAPRPNYSQSN